MVRDLNRFGQILTVFNDFNQFQMNFEYFEGSPLMSNLLVEFKGLQLIFRDFKEFLRI